MQDGREPSNEKQDRVRRLIADALDYSGIVDHSGVSVRTKLVDEGCPVS